jgi:preprotein translocase subunit SecE
MTSDRQTDGKDSSNPGPEPTEPHRENVPGELDHASGQVEEFEAGLVSGAEGTPTDASDEELDRQATEQVGDLDDDGDVDDEDRKLARTGGRSPEIKSGSGGPRFLQFLKASWAELQRVQWPDRRQVGQATAVVLGFVIIAGAYLGLADYVAGKIVDFII